MELPINFLIITFFISYVYCTSEPVPIPDCPENEQWSVCSVECEQQCNNFRGEKCPPIVYRKDCIQKCVCKEGYLRLEEDKCVSVRSDECGGASEYKVKDARVPRCPENMFWSFCKRPCEIQCQNFKGEKCDIRTPIKCASGCICKIGYVLIEEDKCVPFDSSECGGYAQHIGAL